MDASLRRTRANRAPCLGRAACRRPPRAARPSSSRLGAARNSPLRSTEGHATGNRGRVSPRARRRVRCRRRASHVPHVQLIATQDRMPAQELLALLIRTDQRTEEFRATLRTEVPPIPPQHRARTTRDENRCAMTRARIRATHRAHTARSDDGACHSSSSTPASCLGLSARVHARTTHRIGIDRPPSPAAFHRTHAALDFRRQTPASSPARLLSCGHIGVPSGCGRDRPVERAIARRLQRVGRAAKRERATIGDLTGWNLSHTAIRHAHRVVLRLREKLRALRAV